LGLAQALYEKHKVLTYPRTDARALPEDYLGTVKDTLKMLTGEGVGKGHDESLLARFSPFAHQILARNWVIPNKRIFNNAKISDHFAIIPDAAGAQAPVRARAEALRHGRQALPRGLLSGGRIHGHDAHHARRRANRSRRKARYWSIPAGWPSMGARDRTGDEGNLVAVQPKETVHTDEVVLNATETRPPHATPKRRCCRPWKAPARWSTTRS
jgi:DNA topoisomerase-3